MQIDSYFTQLSCLNQINESLTKAFRSPETPTHSKIEHVAMLVFVRVFCPLVSIYEEFTSSFRNLIMNFSMLCEDGFLLDSWARSCICTALRIAICTGNVFINMAAIISPEIVFGYLNLHFYLAHLLVLEQILLLKNDTFEIISSDNQYISLGELTYSFRWQFYMNIINELGQEKNTHIYEHTWTNDILTPALIKTLERQFIQVEEEKINRRNPELIKEFYTSFRDYIHTFARSFRQQKIYTSEEIEDMMTALIPIITCALFSLSDEQIKTENEQVFFFNQAITEENAGDLFKHVEQLKRIKKSINQLTGDEKENMLYYLCFDTERIKTQQEPTKAMKECGELLLNFKHDFLDTHMQYNDADAFAQAFVID